MTEPGNRTWSYGYDQRGRQVSATDPDSGTSTSTYDDMGQMLTSTDARLTTLSYKYDDLGRKTGTYQGATQLAAWVYDTAYKGQLYYSRRFVSSTNHYTTLYPTRDSFYRPTTTRYGIAGEASALNKTYAFTTNYNNDGTVAGLGLPAAGGLAAENVAFTYDDDNLHQITAVNGNTAYSSGYQYSTTGQLLQVQASTGTVKTWNTFKYETGTNRLTRNYLLRSTDAAYVTDTAYNYDDAGNVTSMLDTPASATTDQQCFSYDHLARLTQAYTTTSTASAPCATAPTPSLIGGQAPYWHSYSYDASSNREVETINPTSVNTTKTTKKYTYVTASNRLDKVDTTVGSTTKTSTYGYDNAGNTKSRPTTTGVAAQTFDWDAENHLAASTESNATTTYAYDADGNRLLRREPTATTLYLPGLELKLTTSTGTVTGTRFIGLGGALTAVRTASGVTFTAADHHGTGDTAVDAATGTVTVTRRHYTPFGVSRDASTFSWVTNRGFIDGTMDPTGLTHLGAREYDPIIGRFTSVDPLLDLADPTQWNGYAYSNNNPVTLSDPSGLLGRTPDDDAGNEPRGDGSPNTCRCEVSDGDDNGGGNNNNNGGDDGSVSLDDAASTSDVPLATLQSMGYDGSSKYTYNEALDWADDSEAGYNFVCIHTFGISADACGANNRWQHVLENPAPAGDIILGLVKGGTDTNIMLKDKHAPELSGREQEELAKKHAGLPHDRKIVKSAERKLITGQKYAGTRDVNKRKEQYGATSETLSTEEKILLGVGVTVLGVGVVVCVAATVGVCGAGVAATGGVVMATS